MHLNKSNKRVYPPAPDSYWYDTRRSGISKNDDTHTTMGKYPQTTTPNLHFTPLPLQQLPFQTLMRPNYSLEYYNPYYYGYPGYCGSNEFTMNVSPPKILLTKSKRLSLIPISLEHVQGLFRVYNDELVTHFVTINRHYELNETGDLVKYYLNLVRMQNALVFTIWNNEDHSIIGSAGIYEIDKINKKASLGAVIHSKYWNRGYVTEVCQQLLEIGFKELRLIRIEGCCAEENIASEKLMKKIGMTYEGILRSNLVINEKSTNTKVYSILQKEFYRTSV